MDGTWGGAQVTALAAGEYLLLLGTATVAFGGQFYRKRWAVEPCLQNLKRRGFAWRATHLQGRDRLKKPVGLAGRAHAFWVRAGALLHGKVPSITRQNHGYQKAGFSRRGRPALRECLRPGNRNAAESGL
ncbi:hypothetical protein DDQ68_05185 [Hymenobacter nivis]|uniref:Transposase IS4-like domain-containing protein n=1 Tax=Hymenobacter nivis TaxID=1850093 RepID=A0A2Z3GH02_9BACT|nr:hypothetical protein DDQ68_05185 [Hymenobacter nivis]